MSFRIAVESWEPAFGTSVVPDADTDAQGFELRPADAHVDANVETKVKDWRPLTPSVPGASRVRFVDGVRRVDALAWISSERGETTLGIAASYAAGVVCASSRAEIQAAEVRRRLYTSSALRDLETRVGTYATRPASGDKSETLSTRLQQDLRELELDVTRANQDSALNLDADLVILDGPLSAQLKLRRAVGYVKTHRVSYLDPETSRVVEALEPCQRTPLFLTTSSWSRYSCYVRLPGQRAHPWADVARIEISAESERNDAIATADLAAATLPRYASAAHKESRAPQNLYPIGGLERELRHRLGDASFVRRALRAAAAAYV